MPPSDVSVSADFSCKEEDPEDIFSTSLNTLYDYVPITQSDAGTTFNYIYAEAVPENLSSEEVKGSQINTIQLKLSTPDTLARNWELHASSIWTSAVFLADHISELRIEEFFSPEMQNGTHIVEILELGAGAGLPGLLLSKYLERLRNGKNDWSVTLSDYPDDLLIENLRENVHQNMVADAVMNRSDITEPVPRVYVTPYAWGSATDVFLTSGERGFDIILAADTLWNSSLHDIFAQTLGRLLRRTKSARAHLVAGLHTGRHAISRFLQIVSETRSEPERAQDTGSRLLTLRVLQIMEMEVETGRKRKWKVDREGEDYGDRRRWLAWIVLAWDGFLM